MHMAKKLMILVHMCKISVNFGSEYPDSKYTISVSAGITSNISTRDHKSVHG